MDKDYYDILGVSRKASPQEIKAAYRELAKKYHPDRNQGDTEIEQKFKDINNAYDILKDEQKRAAYDRFGESAFNGTGGGPNMGGFDFSGAGSSFADIFEDLFSGGMGAGAGRGSGRSNARTNLRGSDLRYNLEISLEEAFRGEKQTIKIPTQVTCNTCKGSGSAEKEASTDCSTCDGVGRVRMQQGFFTLERTCTTCQGTGHVIKNPCKACRGNGRIKKQRTLSVNIPKGVEEGTRIRLSREGEAGMRGGEPGDLYIFVSLKSHNLFIREANDLHCHIPIPLTIAALGGNIEVPTIDGHRAKVTIPAGTQNGHQFRLKGKGMPAMQHQNYTGDMYVHADIETPVKLSKEQKELLEEFASLSTKTTNPATESFATKVKRFLNQFKKS